MGLASAWLRSQRGEEVVPQRSVDSVGIRFLLPVFGGLQNRVSGLLGYPGRSQHVSLLGLPGGANKTNSFVLPPLPLLPPAMP